MNVWKSLLQCSSLSEAVEDEPLLANHGGCAGSAKKKPFMIRSWSLSSISYEEWNNMGLY